MIDLLIQSNLIVTTLLTVLIIIVLYNVLIKKKRPSNHYTPFDYITGQSEKEFHDEGIEEENQMKK